MNDVGIEGQAMASMLQGALVVGAMQFTGVQFGVVRQPVRVEQPVDSEGAYESYFRVHLASGAVVRVSFAVEPTES